LFRARRLQFAQWQGNLPFLHSNQLIGLDNFKKSVMVGKVVPSKSRSVPAISLCATLESYASLTEVDYCIVFVFYGAGRWRDIETVKRCWAYVERVAGHCGNDMTINTVAMPVDNQSDTLRFLSGVVGIPLRCRSGGGMTASGFGRIQSIQGDHP
jgi:hypothetical protein